MDVKAKRGDAVAWKTSVCYAGNATGPTVYYHLGEVVSVSRDGLVKKVRQYRGTAKIPVDADLRTYSRYVIPADRFDVKAMLDAYAVEAPYGFGGKNEDEAWVKLREFVMRFAKEVVTK
ncbi:MAG: hypothetical protein ACPLQO_00170 [Desulfotomaculales bacterium]